MTEIQKNHEIFVRESGGGTNDRDEVLKQLAAANDAYFELKGNLQEGTKFYNDLTQLLVTFQSKVIIIFYQFSKYYPCYTWVGFNIFLIYAIRLLTSHSLEKPKKKN